MIEPLRIFFSVVIGLVVVWSALLMWSIAPDIEAKLSPVFGDAALYEQRPQSDGSIQFRFKIDRLKNCQRIESHWYEILPDGEFALSEVKPIGTPGLPRPLGWNISLWNVAPAPGVYSLRVDHNCGWPWITRTTAGPFVIGEAAK